MKIHHYPNLTELSRQAAKRVLGLAFDAAVERGIFTLALSGGGTPKAMHAVLVAEPFKSETPWERVHLFWGDERWVGPESPHSNFRMARETLISKVPVPPGNVHPVPTDLEAPDEAARAYAEEIGRVLTVGSSRKKPGPVPRFDLILLGIGRDGHTASLFPNDPNLEEAERWVVATREPKGEPLLDRITLTLPVINRARSIFMLVSGRGKSEAVREILADPEGARDRFPAARVIPREGVEWFIDDEVVYA